VEAAVEAVEAVEAVGEVVGEAVGEAVGAAAAANGLVLCNERSIRGCRRSHKPSDAPTNREAD
jgi:hypothetical protein